MSELPLYTKHVNLRESDRQSLEELWDEEQYKEEFDASSFLAALPSKP